MNYPNMDITEDEARCFLKDVLGVDSSVVSGDKLSYLNQLVYRLKNTIPVHNLSLLATATENRILPPWSDIKRDMFSRKGALGILVNVFFCSVLRSLGFDAKSTVAVTYALDAFHAYYVIILVHHVTRPGDIFLVDVGNEYPSFEAIPLDFQDESVVYTHSFLEYKFMRKDGKVLRLHNRGKHESRAQIDSSLDGFYIFYDFITDAKSDNEIVECLRMLHADPKASPYHKSLKISTFCDGKGRVLKDNILFCENDSRKMEPMELASTDEVLAKIRECFPLLDSETVDEAVKQWKIYH